jgi:DNA-binding GntR family transcriptional regulator
VQILANGRSPQRYRLLAATRQDAAEISHEHRQVLTAFEQHDGPAAAAALSAHLLSVLEDLTRQDLADLVARARQGDRPTTQHNAHQE